MKRLELFPDTTRVTQAGLSIGGCDLAALARTHGTPLYVYDEATLNAAAALYRRSLAKLYPGKSGITYAGKAYLSLAMAQWTQQQGLWLDCTGQGELAVAGAAGVRPERLIAHGVNKSERDLELAIQQAGTLVVDNLPELERLLAMTGTGSLPDLWLRFQPGVAVETHAHIQTGQAGSKFGLEAGALLEAAGFCRRHGLPLKGLHFHLGSQFREAAPLIQATERAMDLAAEMGFEAGWTFSPGGGWGVAYNEAQLPHPDIEETIAAVADTVVRCCRVRALALPHLQVEPGRSLVAKAGVAVYRAGTVKLSGGRTWVLLDGGLADNPRHALYGVNYSALLVHDPFAPNVEQVCLAGPYCESGDILSMDLARPEVKAGDLVAVPVSGAYQLSMASNYNGACRPAVLWLKDSQARLIQQREVPADLFRRDRPLSE